MLELIGDGGSDRTFSFLKPNALVTYSPTQQRQIRFRALREVSQLNFFDFVSSTDFDDNELALGNPDLSPQSTWVVDATIEQRFDANAVVSATFFYNRISDVQGRAARRRRI